MVPTWFFFHRVCGAPYVYQKSTPIVHKLPFKFPFFFSRTVRKKKTIIINYKGKKRGLYKNNSSYRSRNFFFLATFGSGHPFFFYCSLSLYPHCRRRRHPHTRFFTVVCVCVCVCTE